ncbi:MAG: thioredoxin fold domain-containing protein [Gammaproteobacteria bacterium]|nr:thioredoxin fold domain-containing protein [Gammaproteobacteria bacterium]
MRLLVSKFISIAALAVTLLASNAWAADYSGVESSLARINPDLKASSIAVTPMLGMYDVLLTSGDRIYMSEDGEFFFAGTMYQNASGQGLVNLTEQGAVKNRMVAMQSPAAQQVWVFPAVGSTKASISVFTDIDCYYCQKLHSEMAAINALGIEVRYLAFPRAGLGSSSYQQLADSWCAENPNEFLTQAKLRSHNKQAPLNSPVACNNPVAAHYNLGQQIGVTGTPAIILDNGELWPGYLPANELAKRLGLL